MILRRPIWTEGLFVVQHHMQQQDRYHEAYVDERLNAAVMWPWGVVSVEIDERALVNNQLRLTQLMAILPDGTPVDCSDASGDAPAPRQLDGAFPPSLASLPVHIALAHWKENASNVVTESRTNVVARYQEQTSRVSDTHTGGEDRDISWARPTFRLLLGNENREAFDTVQIAELVRTHTGAIVLRDNYVPPVLKTSASPFLVAGFRRVLTAMTSRQRGLAASRRQRTEAAVDFQASDAAKFWLLNALNEAIPQFAHIVDHGHLHPEASYLALGQLIGRLCTFAVDGDPTTIPKFNYLSLGDVFEPMFARAVSLLDTIIAERFTEIPLEVRGQGMFTGQVQNPVLLRHELFLAVTGSLSEADIRDRLPKLTKIASWNHINALLNSAVNGVRLEVEYRPPGALPIRPGVVFFRVQKTAEYWPDVQGTGTVAIYHPLGQGVNLALYAVDPQNL